MNKILVVGCPGAGKSTFSQKLNKILNVPLYHLDNIWHKSDKTHITRDEFDLKLKEILLTDEWIIDGDYSRTYEIRIEYANTIIFLDYPTKLCLKSAEERIGTKRIDIPFSETTIDQRFKESIINWKEETFPKLKDLLDKYKDKKEIIDLNQEKKLIII